MSMQIHELANCHPWSWLVFSNFITNFYQRCKQETTRSTVKCFIVPAFPLSGKNNYVAEELSAEHQCAITSWDHYLTT